jgi:hypothetical protein
MKTRVIIEYDLPCVAAADCILVCDQEEQRWPQWRRARAKWWRPSPVGGGDGCLRVRVAGLVQAPS